ncbi:hypothetical protein Tco_0270462 [Tanacetum coccineum]
MLTVKNRYPLRGSKIYSITPFKASLLYSKIDLRMGVITSLEYDEQGHSKERHSELGRVIYEFQVYAIHGTNKALPAVFMTRGERRNILRPILELLKKEPDRESIKDLGHPPKTPTEIR